MFRDLARRVAIAIAYLLAANNVITTWQVVTRLYAPSLHVRFDPYWVRVFGDNFIVLDVIVVATLASMALVSLVFAIAARRDRSNLVYGIIATLLNVVVAIDWIGYELGKVNLTMTLIALILTTIVNVITIFLFDSKPTSTPVTVE